MSRSLRVCVFSLPASLLLIAAFAFAGDLSANSAVATARAECLSVASKILGRQVNYCTVLPPGYDAGKTHRYPVLYLLHGLGDNEQFLIHDGGFNLIEDLWERNQLAEFVIATPAAEATFYINSRDGHRYEDFFLQEFVPLIEQRYRVTPARASRGVAGISMGGYGALHIAFRHARLFGSVGAHSAALLEKLPVIRSPDSRQLVRLRILGGAFGVPFDPAFWKRNDPLTLARTANLAGLRIYFDCGSQDDYGFDAGAAALDQVLASRHVPHEFHLYPGRHNWAYFAEHLPSLLQFHAKSFTSGTP